MRLLEFINRYKNVKVIQIKHGSVFTATTLEDNNYQKRKRIRNLCGLLDVEYDESNFNMFDDMSSPINECTLINTNLSLSPSNDIEDDYIKYIDNLATTRTIDMSSVTDIDYEISKHAYMLMGNNFTYVTNNYHLYYTQDKIINNRLRNIIYAIQNDNIVLYVNHDYTRSVFHCPYSPIKILKINLV